jgi:hypothetical protein
MASQSPGLTDSGTLTPPRTSPLPYLVIFAILIITLLIVLSFLIYYWSKSHLCGNQAHFWCSDTWTCNTPCPAGSTGHSECFNNGELKDVGLASCLYGPDIPGAHVCYNPPSGEVTGVSCNCTTVMEDQTNNCFSGCPSSLGAVNPATTCCCKPGSAGCPFTELTLPNACRPAAG